MRYFHYLFLSLCFVHITVSATLAQVPGMPDFTGSSTGFPLKNPENMSSIVRAAANAQVTQGIVAVPPPLPPSTAEAPGCLNMSREEVLQAAQNLKNGKPLTGKAKESLEKANNKITGLFDNSFLDTVFFSTNFYKYSHATCGNNLAQIASALSTVCAKETNPQAKQSCENSKEILREEMRNNIDRLECFAIKTSGRGGKGHAAYTYGLLLNKFLQIGGVGCWFCPIFKTIFTTANKLATNLYMQLRDIALAFIFVGGMMWLLWTVFKFITTIHGPNVGELMTTLFKGLGTILLVTITLQPTPAFYSEYILDPISIAATNIGRTVIEVQNYQSTNNTNVDFHKYTKCVGGRPNMKLCQKDQKLAAASSGQVLSSQVYDQMNCLLQRMSAELIMGLALGCTFFNEGLSGGKFNLPRFNLMLVGLFLIFTYFALYVMVPFKLIDLILRLSFLICLLPIFIVCFVFKASRSYTAKAFQMFLSCWIGLVSLSLFITFAMHLINSAFG